MTNSNDYIICTSNFELRQLPLTTDFDECGSQSWMEKGKARGEEDEFEDGDWKVEGEKRGERKGVYSLVCSIILSLYLLS